jgi:hypothetical protein
MMLPVSCRPSRRVHSWFLASQWREPSGRGLINWCWWLSAGHSWQRRAYRKAGAWVSFYRFPWAFCGVQGEIWGLLVPADATEKNHLYRQFLGHWSATRYGEWPPGIWTLLLPTGTATATTARDCIAIQCERQTPHTPPKNKYFSVYSPVHNWV